MTRARAIELLKENLFCCNFEECNNAWDCDECVEALSMAIQALEQETVSRETYTHEFNLRKEFEMKVFELEKKIAEQEPKRGKWIKTSNDWIDGHCGQRFFPYHCGCCGYKTWEDELTNYCPFCGAKMEKEQ